MQPTLKLSAIVSGPNHRQYFDPQAMKELEAGIRAAGGVTQPILVRPHPEREGVFEIMAGERRWRAATHGPWRRLRHACRHPRRERRGGAVARHHREPLP